MKTTLRVSFAATVLVAMTGCAAPGFLDLRAPVAVSGNADAGAQKAAVCTACHGPNGVSPIPTFPNIAGQKADYLYWQLVEFQRKVKPDSPMTAIVAGLSDTDLRDLAAHFAAQTPAPASGDANAFADGARLYREGDPARGFVPCQGCHGANADGNVGGGEARYRAYPSLRGQHSPYLVQRLQDFRNDKYALSSNDHIMHGVTQALDDQAIAQVAGWLQAAPP